MMIASASDSVCRMALTMRPRLSPTLTCKHESMPDSANCSPSQAELVSIICPSKSSVPTATTSQRIAMSFFWRELRLRRIATRWLP